MTSDHVEGMWDASTAVASTDGAEDLSISVGNLISGAERSHRSVLKRAVDILGALVGLILLAPVLILVSILIVMESPGPFLFTQRRTGLGGVPFVILKYRTMRVREDGEDVMQAKRGDSRVTNIGALLRRSSVDELPQLWNVLKGEMSLVGPRPHALAHDSYYGRVIPDYVQRFRAKPGLTGLAQVEGFRGETAQDSEMADRVTKDLEYIRDWSLLLDIKIILRTILIFAFHPAAY